MAGIGRGWDVVGGGRGLLAHRICILGAALRSTGWHRHAVRLPGRDAYQERPPCHEAGEPRGDQHFGDSRAPGT